MNQNKENDGLLKDITKIIKEAKNKIKKIENIPGLAQCPDCTMFCDYKIVFRKGRQIKKYYCPDCDISFYLKP